MPLHVLEDDVPGKNQSFFFFLYFFLVLTIVCRFFSGFAKQLDQNTDPNFNLECCFDSFPFVRGNDCNI